MSKSIELITNPTLRAEHMNRVELLSQVGELKRLPKAKYSTTKQVAEFYNVSNQTINNAVALNRHEIFNAGVKQYKYENIKNAFCEKGLVEEGMWNNFRSENGIAKNITNLFPKKAVLLVGFILDKSPVADKLRDIAIRQADLFEPNVESTVVTTPVTVINNTSVGTIAVPNTKMPTIVVEQPKAELVVIEPVDIQSVQKQHNDMQVTVIKNKGNEPLVIDSRDVAEMVGKNHKEVMRDIRTIIEHLGGERKIALSYFIESEYTSSQNKKQPCYLLTKKGCELFSTRMTGAKGTQFAVTYIERFNEMEEQLKSHEIVPMASYMIGDPIERAKLWIQEEEQRMLLVETVETQVKVIEYKDEIIENQAQVISEQEQKIMKATAIMFEQKEMIADNINEKYARAYEMSRGYTPREMRNQINNMIQVNFPNSSKDGWNKLYNAYNVKYNVNVMQMKKDYEKKNHTSITIIEFVELDTIMISQLYDLALKLFSSKGAFEKYYK